MNKLRKTKTLQTKRLKIIKKNEATNELHF